jgi:hypothetical protein
MVDSNRRYEAFCGPNSSTHLVDSCFGVDTENGILCRD